MNKLSDMVCIDTVSTIYPSENDAWYVYKYSNWYDLYWYRVDVGALPSEWLDIQQTGMIFRVLIAWDWINDAYGFIANFSGIDFVSTLWHCP